MRIWNSYSEETRDKRQKYMQSAGAFIKECRMRKNKSQKEVASELGFKSHSEVSSFETARVDMPYSNLPLILELLGASQFQALRKIIPDVEEEFHEARNELKSCFATYGTLSDPDVVSQIDMMPAVSAEYMSRISDSYKHREQEDVSGQLVIHDDPTFAVMDCINLIRLISDNKEEADSTTRSLLRAILYYWAIMSVNDPEYRKLLDSLR